MLGLCLLIAGDLRDVAAVLGDHPLTQHALVPVLLIGLGALHRTSYARKQSILSKIGWLVGWQVGWVVGRIDLVKMRLVVGWISNEMLDSNLTLPGSVQVII